jgi:hypothetical protein
VALLSVETDIDEVVKAFQPSKVKRVISSATASALNRGIKAAQKEAVKDVADLNALKKGLVKRMVVRVEKKHDHATRRKLRSKIWASFHPIDLREIAHPSEPRQTKKGVNIGRRHKYPGHFIATMKNGHTNVFSRRGKKRLKIDKTVFELHPRTPVLVRMAVNGTGAKVFKKRLIHELRHRIRRLK